MPGALDESPPLLACSFAPVVNASLARKRHWPSVMKLVHAAAAAVWVASFRRIRFDVSYIFMTPGGDVLAVQRVNSPMTPVTIK